MVVLVGRANKPRWVSRGQWKCEEIGNHHAMQATLLVETINSDAFTVFRIMLQVWVAFFFFWENCHKNHIFLCSIYYDHWTRNSEIVLSGEIKVKGLLLTIKKNWANGLPSAVTGEEGGMSPCRTKARPVNGRMSLYMNQGPKCKGHQRKKVRKSQYLSQGKWS